MRKRLKSNPTLILCLLLAIGSSYVNAQNVLTLRGCIDYSLENNRNIKIANYNADISRQKTSEQIGGYLPQINISGSVDNNLKLATQLLPAEMMGGTAGTYIPITFGNKYSVSGGVQLTQKIYDPLSLSSIKTSKLNGNISAISQQQSKELTAYSISLAYFQAWVIKMQLNVLQTTLLSSEDLLLSMTLKYQNGMARKIDVDKIRVSYNNTKSQLEQAELNYNQSLNSLKYYMGMPVDSILIIADTAVDENLDLFITDSTMMYQINDISDYQLQKANAALMQMNKKTQLASCLPSLSFYGNYNYNAMRQEFNFFDTNKDWYPSSGIGIKLSVPVFSGLQRSTRLAQSNLSIKIADENLIQTEQNIRVSIANYYIRFKNALDNIANEKANLELADGVYKDSQMEFEQGTGSTLDLIQSESSYLIAQSNYYSKLLDLYIARIEYEKAKGSLIQFVNNLK